MRALAEITAWWAVLTGLTLICISTVSVAELAVAVAAALGGALAARRIRRAAGVRIHGATGAAATALRLPGAVLAGSARLAVSLVHGRREAGLHRVRLRAGADAGWAGLVMGASPDTCVVEVTRPDELLVHRLGSSPGSLERVLSRRDGSG